MNAVVVEMSEKSKDLDVANKTISNIASETNLLAMNAAIEASHAGNAGLGFAVVADEIRNLAESSAVQSKEIKILIDRIVEAATQSDTIYKTTNNEMETTYQIVSTIKNAMSEQDTGSQQIIDVLKQMREVTFGVSDAGKKMNESQIELSSLTKELTSSTAQVTHSLIKTSGSARNVSEIENELLNAAGKVNDVIDVISDKIDGFKIK